MIVILPSPPWRVRIPSWRTLTTPAKIPQVLPGGPEALSPLPPPVSSLMSAESVCLSVCLSGCLSVWLSVCLSVCLSFCLQLSGVCKVSRITSKMPVRVILVFAFHASVGQANSTLGCFRDTGSRAIPFLEGQDPLLDGSYRSRQNPIHKCYLTALKRGYQVFAVQHGGQCFSGPTAHQTYNKYGPSDECKSDGEGGPWANQVYNITGLLTTRPASSTVWSLSDTNWSRGSRMPSQQETLPDVYRPEDLQIY